MGCSVGISGESMVWVEGSVSLSIAVTDAILAGRLAGENLWHLTTELTDDAGITRRIAHVIPETTFEWRVAEYDLDPSDGDTLLNMVLYEPYLENVPTQGSPLWNSPTIKVARQLHLNRITALRGAGRLTSRRRRDTEYRATTITLLITVTGMITGGSFTIGFRNQNTAPITPDATPETLRSALETLPGFQPGDITVTTGPTGSGSWTVLITKPTPVGARLTADATGLTGTNTDVLLTRTVNRGTARVLVDSDTEAGLPLQVVYQESPIDPELVAVRRELVIRTRERARAQPNTVITAANDQFRIRPTPARLREQFTPVIRRPSSGR